jgi:hypothetical protein
VGKSLRELSLTLGNPYSPSGSKLLSEPRNKVMYMKLRAFVLSRSTAVPEALSAVITCRRILGRFNGLEYKSAQASMALEVI